MLKFKIELRLLLALIFFLAAITFALDTAPVFIMDDGLLDGVVKTQTNPLIMTSAEEFEAMVNIAQKRSQCLLFFVEDEFSFEDISSKDERGTPYFHLKKAFLDRKVKMLPRVFEPYNHLKNRFQPFDFNTFHVSRTTTKLRLQENYKFIYIFFEDGTNETRIQKLRRHDLIMQEVIFAVKQLSKGPIIAFYTGKQNPVEFRSNERQQTAMSRRPTPATPKNNLIVLCGNASFEFTDTLMQHAGETHPTTIRVDKCDYLSGGPNDWAYSISFEDLTKDDVSNSPFYELRFFFSYDNPRNHRAGWKLGKVAYVSQRKGVLKTKWFDIVGKWDEYYLSPRPLILQPDLKFSNMPTLDIKSYRIYLSSSELLVAAPSAPTKSTESTSSTQMSESKERNMFHYEAVGQDEVAPRGIQEILDTLGQMFDYTPKKDYVPSSDGLTDTGHAMYITIELANSYSVVGIILYVLFFGIQMLMAVKTNSMYDSPDQPPLFSADFTGD